MDLIGVPAKQDMHGLVRAQRCGGKYIDRDALPDEVFEHGVVPALRREMHHGLSIFQAGPDLRAVLD